MTPIDQPKQLLAKMLFVISLSLLFVQNAATFDTGFLGGTSQVNTFDLMPPRVGFAHEGAVVSWRDRFGMSSLAAK